MPVHGGEKRKPCHYLSQIFKWETTIPLIDGLARVTPSPQDFIQFQPNDVLGFYVESASIRGPSDNPNGLVASPD